MPLSKYDVLAKVREHFSRPGAVFGYEDRGCHSGCVYRGNEDPSSPVRCAVGIFISDEMYDPFMEGESAETAVREAGIAEMFEDSILARDGDSTSWLNDLQAVHDRTARKGGTVADFLVALDHFERYGEVPA